MSRMYTIPVPESPAPVDTKSTTSTPAQTGTTSVAAVNPSTKTDTKPVATPVTATTDPATLPDGYLVGGYLDHDPDGKYKPYHNF